MISRNSGNFLQSGNTAQYAHNTFEHTLAPLAYSAQFLES